MKKILVINIGWEQEPLLDLISQQENIEVYGVHYNNDYYKSVSYKDLLITDLRNLQSIIDFAKKIETDAVISDECDYSHYAQSCISEILSLPGPNIRQAQLSSNKYLQRLKCKQNNILVPRFSLCADVKEVEDFASKEGLPIILKPIDNRGSFGVNKIDKTSEIPDAFYDALINSHARLVLTEQFVEGIHVTVDGYVFQGTGCKSLALASKGMIGTNRQVAMDILYPGEISDKIYAKTMKTSESACAALGYSFGRHIVNT